ncbi:putative calcium-transporting ATPase [Rosa chinensis]|uniref:Calcium-transporting ATPase n=1 Tax=Rosa chinensis TaxID=74649 RepID=A0A2P6QPQ4_ROSCH|nr:putative calcium-transporting ATPase [Rosa chinensis]
MSRSFGSLQAKVGSNVGLILDVPSSNLGIRKRKWHSAFNTIYCSRAFLSLRPSTLPEHTNSTLISPTLSYSIVRVEPVSVPAINGFKADQKSLTELVKEKNLNKLLEIGRVEEVASALKTDAENGINGDDAEDIARRHEAFGSNTYKKPPTQGFLHFVCEAFKELTILILLGCAALSLGISIKEQGLKEGWIDGGSICLAVIVFDKLYKVSNNLQIEAVRNGRRQLISLFEIVVGDVICLKIRDQVPADGLLLEGHSLSVDESSITGENDHVEITIIENPFLFSGTKIADGYGRVLVMSVGMNTNWGEKMSRISQDTIEKTPLQARLDKLTSSMGKVGLAVAFFVLVVMLVRYFTGNTENENGNKEYNGSKTKSNDIINAVIGIVAAAVTIVEVAIPEGLPLAVILSLAFSMRRMMVDNAMVRKLSACETMESATTICTDKTGTLTMNQMKVTKFWLGKEFVEEEAYSAISPYVLNLIQEGVSLNTTGSVYRPSLDSEIEISGSPTEKAILSWAVHGLKMDLEKVVKSCSVLHVEAFNSKKKQSGVMVKRKADNSIHVHWKGAAEMILAMCTSYYTASGLVKDMDENNKTKFEHIIQGLAASSLRCIAFAHNQVPAEDQLNVDQKVLLTEDGLTLLGLVGLEDPCRPGVRKAIEECQYAGVNVKMITGDNVFIAKAIATECGILRPGQDMHGAVIETIEFRNYKPEERLEKVDKICVMARSSPFDKLLMVHCLKQKGLVVAVTGDGTNDAPALKEADIGLSMGI